jgi:hypothetical protein
MRIEWKINKRAGHLRPKLYYCIILEAFEVALAVPMVSVTSTIPKPPDAGQYFVWPGTKERGKEAPDAVYELSTPSHQTARRRETLMLPMRADNHYPEVEESFLELRRAYEAVLLEAYGNTAFETEGHLDMSAQTKRRLAPSVIAERFLSLVSKAS